MQDSVPNSDATAQDCARCPYRDKCWRAASNTSESALVINLLVCRLKSGIKVNASTRLLLRMLRPKIVKTAQWIQQTVAPIDVDLDTVIAELESECIMRLLHDYDLGGRLWPLPFLFGRQYTGIRGWALRYANRVRRDAATHYLYGGVGEDDGTLEARLTAANAALTRMPNLPPALPTTAPDTPAAVAPDAYERLEDGVTMSLTEYRVMRFCMQGADGRARSLVRGLHGFLARHTGIRRRTISKYYRKGCYKLRRTTGRAPLAPGVCARRHACWLYGLGPGPRLTPEEIYGLLHATAAVAQPGQTLTDICWSYGVSDRWYYKIRDRYGGLSIDEIRVRHAAAAQR